MGTDNLGRDLAARVIVGLRLSLTISVLAGLGAGIIGLVLGVSAGVAGGRWDQLVTVVTEAMLALPFILVGLMVAATVGAGVQSVLLLLVLTGWVSFARTLRLQSNSVSHSDFVTASRAMGGGRPHILLAHVVPNVLPIFLVILFQTMGIMVIWSASLTYLGIGLPVNSISLGGIVRDGQELLYTAWWVSAFGGLAIVALVTSFNAFADWLRHRLDPLSTRES